MNTASTLVTWGIPSIAIVVLGVVVLLEARAAAKLETRKGLINWPFVVALALWLGTAAALAGSGVLSQWHRRPPPMALMFPAVFALAGWAAFSRVGTTLRDGASFTALVALQAFRLPLELVMHQAAVEGTMPNELSFSGYNFDIVTGLSAIALAAILATGRTPRALIWGWNVLGLVMLANITVIAGASTPFIHAFGTDPAHLNTWVALFPFVWLPTALVSTALAGHLVITRKLLRKGAGESETTT
jgi:hypothetical protein